MLFAKNESYGVKSSMFLNNLIIGYVNLSRVKVKEGITAGSASSVDVNKKLALIKSYNEHLERFSLGIPIDSNKEIQTFNLLKKNIMGREFDEFGYGLHQLGYNDTTGTASGKKTDFVIKKAMLELLEKNEVFCFWYGKRGRRVVLDNEVKELIKLYNFISDEFYIFLLSELSNYPTIIVLGFLDKELLTSGVACADDINNSIKYALREAKSIEWQTYDNPLAKANKFSKESSRMFRQKVLYKKHTYKPVTKNFIEKTEKLEIVDWVTDIECALIGEDIDRGIKTIKCVSKQLLNSMPIKKNVSLQKNKEIVIRYLDDFSIDCPIQ